MKATFVLTPAEARRLIAKTVIQMPEFQKAWKEAYVLLAGGTTNAFIAQELLGKGYSVTIFPEGTRGDSDEMAPFKEGSMKIAEKTGCPIVPMAISHTRDIIKDHKPIVKPTHVTVEYGTPIYPKELAKEEKRALGRLSQNMIQEMLDAQKASEQQ